MSLNDHLLAGPKVQSDSTTVLLKWRNFKFVYTADITKMYRQIFIDSRDLDFQRILWKPNSETVPIDYQLLTVTYGMTCAPFLALRVIQQLADEGIHFPLAMSILRENMYVDDVLFGNDEISQLVQTQEQLVQLLRRGGFELCKWAGNSPRLLNDINAENHGLACPKSLSSNETLKILGIEWNPANDMFQISAVLEHPIPESKRQVLAAIVRLYDSLGWVTPVTITAKIFMQRLWREGFDWDSILPPTLLNHWRNIYSGLSALRELRLNR
ncbi:uncharacterized protein LOC116853401 [Odontomachus brunneus]|uniref:uncharacterized protein LOC116853401 n=1 Tax=Odontomachus brunneus TaxID=486640 RepID=UPI0013F20731|nr:uncharacterized protein LOC116853401 [Odontomachus brunneus]